MLRKKFFRFLLSGILMPCAMLSCGIQTGNETQKADSTESVVSSAEIRLTEGTKALYKVIRPEEASDNVVQLAVELRRGLEEITGVKFEFGTDWVKHGEQPDDTAYEILVGQTNRTASQTFGETLSGIEYGINVDGNKIVVYGANPMSLEKAVELFLKGNVLALNDAGNYIVAGVPIVETMTFSEGEIPPYPSNSIESFEPSTDTCMMKISDTTAEGYRDYLAMLESAGFEHYTDNQIGNNLFATYISDTLTVNVYYIDSNKITRIVWEPRGALPGLAKDNVYERKTDTMITSIDLETTMFYEGMSYVIRLADNSFIIIDGGVSDYDGVECEKLMNILTEQTPVGEKPVIAAWLFSHCHGDHIGLMGDFLRDYHDQIEIECFVYNFPTDEEIAASGDSYMLDDSHFRYNAFRNSKEKYFPDVPVIKPHTGNVLYIRNATIEILGTEEDIYPSTIISHGMNASTVYYRMELEGQTIMWLGDSAEINGDIAIEQFGDYLKSDFMQVAHHGYGGGTVRLYAVIDPTYVLYPVAAESYVGNYLSEPNLWFLEKSENVKLVMTAGFGTFSFRMPFSVEDGKYERCQPRRFRDYVNPLVFE